MFGIVVDLCYFEWSLYRGSTVVETHLSMVTNCRIVVVQTGVELRSIACHCILGNSMSCPKLDEHQIPCHMLSLA